MTDDDEELVRRLRSEVPPPDEAAWAAVRGALAREIAAELERPRGGRKTTRRWSPRLLAAAFAALVLSGAVAYGATVLIGVGSPAPNPPLALTPSSIKLLGLRVADPAGGPPWGIRLALSPSRRGSRPGVAIQIGRIRGRQMGFIGEDNVFHNDHLFHAAGPDSALITPADYPITGTPEKPNLQSIYHFALTLPGVASAYEGCSNTKVPVRPVNPRFRQPRRAFESQERALQRQLAILRADGPMAQRDARRSGFSVATLRLMLAETLQHTREQATGFVSERTFATCPASDLRTIAFGFAGPTSASVAISGLGVHEVEPLRPDDDGFYLFILSNHWSYASKFQATVTCQDGRTVSGLAGPGTPDPPYCRAR
jgi:hypothetical protein